MRSLALILLLLVPPAHGDACLKHLARVLLPACFKARVCSPECCAAFDTPLVECSAEWQGEHRLWVHRARRARGAECPAPACGVRVHCPFSPHPPSSPCRHPACEPLWVNASFVQRCREAVANHCDTAAIREPACETAPRCPSEDWHACSALNAQVSLVEDTMARIATIPRTAVTATISRQGFEWLLLNGCSAAATMTPVQCPRMKFVLRDARVDVVAGVFPEATFTGAPDFSVRNLVFAVLAPALWVAFELHDAWAAAKRA